MHAKLNPMTFVCFVLSFIFQFSHVLSQEYNERIARFRFATDDIPDKFPVIRIYDQDRNLIADQEAEIKPTPDRPGSFDCSVKLPLNSYKTLRIESGDSRALITMTDYQLTSGKLGAFYLSDRVIDWDVCYEFHRSSKSNDPFEFPPKPQAKKNSPKAAIPKKAAPDQKPTMVDLTFRLQGVGLPKASENYTTTTREFRQEIENSEFFIIDEINQWEVSHAVAVEPHRDFYSYRKPLTNKEGKAELTVEKGKPYRLIVNPLKKGYAPVVQCFVANDSECGIEFNTVVLSDIPPEVLKARAIQERTYLGEIVFPDGKVTDQPQLKRIIGGSKASKQEKWQSLRSHVRMLDWIIDHDGLVPDFSAGQPVQAMFLLYGATENDQWLKLLDLANNPMYNSVTFWGVINPGVANAPQWGAKFPKVLKSRSDRFKLLGYVSTTGPTGIPRSLAAIEDEIMRYTGQGPKPLVQGIFLDNCTPFNNPDQLQLLYQRVKGMFGPDFKILACIDSDKATESLTNNQEIADVFICSNSANPPYAQIAAVQQEIDKRNIGKSKQTGLIHYGLNANTINDALRQIQTNNCTWCFLTNQIFPEHASVLPDSSILLKSLEEFQSLNQIIVD